MIDEEEKLAKTSMTTSIDTSAANKPATESPEIESLLSPVRQKREWLENKFKEDFLANRPRLSPGHELVEARHKWLQEEARRNREAVIRLNDIEVSQDVLEAKKKWLTEDERIVQEMRVHVFSENPAGDGNVSGEPEVDFRAYSSKSERRDLPNDRETETSSNEDEREDNFEDWGNLLEKIFTDEMVFIDESADDYIEVAQSRAETLAPMPGGMPSYPLFVESDKSGISNKNHCVSESSDVRNERTTVECELFPGELAYPEKSRRDPEKTELSSGETANLAVLKAEKMTSAKKKDLESAESYLAIADKVYWESMALLDLTRGQMHASPAKLSKGEILLSTEKAGVDSNKIRVVEKEPLVPLNTDFGVVEARCLERCVIS
jgi:hypothetical protein